MACLFRVCSTVTGVFYLCLVPYRVGQINCVESVQLKLTKRLPVDYTVWVALLQQYIASDTI